MANKTVMVDFDDCLVDFTQMFLDRANKWLCEDFKKLKDYGKVITKKDIFDYDYRVVFGRYFEDYHLSYELGRMVCEKYLKKCFDDETFYNNFIPTPEMTEIFSMIADFKVKDYRIILNTKVNSLKMVKSKTNLIEKHQFDSFFDEIIFDVECQIGHTEKPTHYKIMFDDSPKNITNYLTKNKTGTVYMPVREWNKHLLQSDLPQYRRLITI